MKIDPPKLRIRRQMHKEPNQPKTSLGKTLLGNLPPLVQLLSQVIPQPGPADNIKK